MEKLKKDLYLSKKNKLFSTSFMKESFGEFIRIKRNEIGLTQTQFAARIGVEAAALSKIETGKKILAEDRLPSLAEVFNIDLAIIKEEYFSEKIAKVLYQNKCSEKTLVLAEQKMQYIKSKNLQQTQIKFG